MAKKSEAEFINEGFTTEELASMGNDTAELPVVVETSETVQQEPPANQETVAEPEPKMVDVRAVQEARAAARAAEAEVARLKAERIEAARLEERINQLNQAIEAQNKPKQPEPVVPSKDEDYLGWNEHQLSTLEQRIAAAEQAEKQRIEQYEAETRRQSTVREADAVIGAAIQKNPELQKAVDFAIDGIRNDIAAEMERRNIPFAQRGAVAQQWLDNVVVDLATKCPRDPDLAADFVMRNARYYGYGYQQQQQAAQQPVQQQVHQPTIQQRAEQQERHMSLSGVQGGTAPVKFDAKSLMSMSDEQYRDLLKTVAGRKQLEEVFGGV